MDRLDPLELQDLRDHLGQALVSVLQERPVHPAMPDQPAPMALLAHQAVQAQTEPRARRDRLARRAQLDRLAQQATPVPQEAMVTMVPQEPLDLPDPLERPAVTASPVHLVDPAMLVCPETTPSTARAHRVPSTSLASSVSASKSRLTTRRSPCQQRHNVVSLSLSAFAPI